MPANNTVRRYQAELAPFLRAAHATAAARKGTAGAYAQAVQALLSPAALGIISEDKRAALAGATLQPAPRVSTTAPVNRAAKAQPASAQAA